MHDRAELFKAFSTLHLQLSKWMCYVVMRLKKSKEPDAKKSQQIDCISRLICTSKTQMHPLSGLLTVLHTAFIFFSSIQTTFNTV